MLVNSLCIDKDLNVYIASDDDICNICLDEFVKENNVTYVMAREQLKNKLKGERIFTLKFHGGIYVLCEHHLQKILEAIRSNNKTKTDETPKHTTKRRGKQNAAEDLA